MPKMNTNKVVPSMLKSGARAGGKNNNFKRQPEGEFIINPKSVATGIMTGVTIAKTGKAVQGAYNTLMANRNNQTTTNIDVRGKLSSNNKMIISDGKISRPQGMRYENNVTNRGIDIDLTATPNTLVGYSVDNKSSGPISFSTPIDPHLYYNSNKEQASPGSSTSIPVYGRTTFRIVSPKPFNGADADVVLKDQFNAYYQELLSNTGGGTSYLASNFTFDNFKSYLQDVYQAYFYLMELNTKIAWYGDNPVPNKVLRRIAGNFGSSTLLLRLRNDLGTELAQLVLPKQMIQYGAWFTQHYKSNELDYAVEQGFISQAFGQLLCDYNTTTYDTAIRVFLTTLKTNSTINQYMAAVLQAKTSGSWTRLNVLPMPSNTSTYDSAFNDIFNNSIMYVPLNNLSKPEAIPDVTQSSSTAPIPACCETPLGKLPIHFTETLSHRISGYAPALWTGAFVDTSYPSSQKCCNTLTIYEDASTASGWLTIGVKEPMDQIGNHVCKLFRNSDTSTATAVWSKYQLSPRGDQVYLYDFAKDMIALAKRSFVEILLN